MHGNQWVLKIAVLKYYSVSKRGTTAKSNPKQATDPISLHTKFGDNSSNTFPLNERKPCVTPDIGRRTAEKAKIIYSPPRGTDIIYSCRYFASNKEIAITHLWHAIEPQTIWHLIIKDKVAEQHILGKYSNCTSFGVTMDLLNCRISK